MLKNVKSEGTSKRTSEDSSRDGPIVTIPTTYKKGWNARTGQRGRKDALLYSRAFVPSRYKMCPGTFFEAFKTQEVF